MPRSLPLPAPSVSHASWGETNLSRPRLGEASELHQHLSHPGPGREQGGWSCSPEPPKTHFQPAWGRFWALLAGFFGAAVSCQSVTTLTAEGSWGGGGHDTAGHADPVPCPGDGSWPHSCLEWALLYSLGTAGSPPGHLKGFISLPSLSMWGRALVLTARAGGSRRCWGRLATVGLVPGEDQPRAGTGRPCVRVGMARKGTQRVSSSSRAAAETQHSTSPFLLPAGGDAAVGSVQQGHLQS